MLVPRWARAAAVACAVCLGVGGTAYAADALGLINLQQSGDYQTLMTVNADEVAAPATGSVADYRLEFAKLPEGAAAFDRDDHLAKYDWADHEEGFSAFLFYLDSSEPLPVSFTTGRHPGVRERRRGRRLREAGHRPGRSHPGHVSRLPRRAARPVAVDRLAHLRRADPYRRGRAPYPHGTEVTPGSDGTLRPWSEQIAQARGAGEEVETAELKLDASAEEMSALHAVGETFARLLFRRADLGRRRYVRRSPYGHGDLGGRARRPFDPGHRPSARRVARLVGAGTGSGRGRHNYVAWGDGRDRLDEVVTTESVPVKLVGSDG